jgi:hypothetical protein
MIHFSADPVVAEQEMRAVIYYLAAFGFVDGDFDATERTFIQRFVRQLVESRAEAAMTVSPDLRHLAVERWAKHFDEVIEEVIHEIQVHAHEPVADGEDSRNFVMAKVKLRCFELFKRFDEASRERLLTSAEWLIQADGVVHPAELQFRDEIHCLLDAPVELDDTALEAVASGVVEVTGATRLPPPDYDHEFLSVGEWDYARTPEEFARQADRDIFLANKVIARLDAMRVQGEGRLKGARDFSDFDGTTPFLDGHVYVSPPKPGTETELLVLGDLHGCYSCLKAALLQADFFGKVERHARDPERNPAFRLVLLGDYIDRGRFSYNGVLRAAMQLFLVAPDYVHLLRGNHEYYVEINNRVMAPVRPAEAMTSIQSIAPQSVFATFMHLFEALPCSFVFDRTIFVHGGIPREDTIAEKWHGLESLNDPEIRFQMLWSDPSEADAVPLDLQKATARFPFGRRQFRSFMARLGLNTMVRGHERVVEGFRQIYDAPEARLLSLFSAGGRTNADLPPESSYREVTPMALTIRHRDGVSEVTPFPIEYERYNDPKYNRFFAEHIGQ